MTILLARADARALPLCGGTVQCCVTSPPYWGLRDYGVQGQLGLEATLEEYVAHMVEVFREVRRVLREDGVLWLNLGDAYCSGTSAPRSPTTTEGFDVPASWAGRCQKERIGCVSGLKPKDLVGIPWRVAFALQADGWWLRSDIIWHKPNPMPESVTDRPTRAHEYVFLLTKSERYYYDAEAVKEPGAEPDRKRNDRIGGATGDTVRHSPGGMMGQSIARNRRSVWTVTTQPYKGAHYATFPEKLIEPCILAGTSAKGACPRCGAPWERIVEHTDEVDTSAKGSRFDVGKTAVNGSGRAQEGERFTKRTVGWRPTCSCDDAGDPRPCIVLDPFCGTATVARVAIQHKRRAACFDISDEYLSEQADRRTRNVQVNLL